MKDVGCFLKLQKGAVNVIYFLIDRYQVKER